MIQLHVLKLLRRIFSFAPISLSQNTLEAFGVARDLQNEELLPLESHLGDYLLSVLPSNVYEIVHYSGCLLQCLFSLATCRSMAIRVAYRCLLHLESAGPLSVAMLFDFLDRVNESEWATEHAPQVSYAVMSITFRGSTSSRVL